MNYQSKLAYLLEEILNQFEDDPKLGWIHYDDDDEPHVMGETLQIFLDRTNDLLYGTDENEEYLSEHSGYPTEEEE